MERRRTISRPTRFLSLQWKIALTLTGILLLANLIVVGITERRVIESFNQQNQRQIAAQFTRWQRLLDDGAQNLLRLASLIPQLDTQLPPDAPLEQRLQALLDEYSALLGIEWGIHSIVFHDKQGHLRAAWPAMHAQTGLHALVQDVLARQRPGTLIECAPDCVQYLVAPQLDTSPTGGGTLSLSHSIAEAVVQFAQTSGSQMVVLSPLPSDGADPGVPLPDTRRITQWRHQIPVLSNPEQTLPVLRALAARFDLNTLARRPVLSQVDDRWFHVALHRRADSDVAYLLIAEATEVADTLQATRNVIALTGLAGFLVATGLLLTLLHGPLTRLKRLVLALPHIGNHEYAHARTLLPRPRRRPLGLDEIDLLIQAVDRLNDELEESDKARTEAEQRLIWMADHDPLTGLFNRRCFQREFERILQHNSRSGRTGALLYFDLDDFKAINDLSGHQAGDRLLRRVSKELKALVEAPALLARLGGDEFAVVLPQCDVHQAEQMAERLLSTLNEIRIVIDGKAHHISASIGIALFPQHGQDVRGLLANADITMYQAKRLGHGRWHLFSRDDPMRELLSARTLWRERIAEALDKDLFILHYQPIMALADDCIAHYEVLIRMRDEGGGLIFPERFITIAEQTGQIQEIDRWVIRHAIAQLKTDPRLALSVNLSANVIDDPELPKWLAGQLDENGIDPAQLTFEITETAAVQDLDAAVRLMEEMRHLGCRFALDDFGSGFASYFYLKRLPVDVVKIDGVFIRHLASNPDDQLFVRALTDVAHGLGKQTVAEFVEDEQTLALLRRYHVHFAQGHLIGRPLRDIRSTDTHPPRTCKEG